MRKPQLRSVLEVLSRERLLDLGRVTGISLRQARDKKGELAGLLSASLTDARLPEVVRELGRDELRAVCRAHALSDEGRRRSDLAERVLIAAGFAPGASIPPRRFPHTSVPQPGQVLAARGRQWLVEGLEMGEEHESPLLSLACLDDDAPGERLEMLWDLEVGARVIDPQSQGLPRPERLDAPATFGAYLHALKWSSVSAADAHRFQAPFRAGIDPLPHQLTPLMKALELPRANLFIADDVGLGKTIEAGLVLQELILRQQAGFVLIVCPASVGLQWRDEMLRRFGLRFEVMSRAFIGHRRRQRGFGVNPWATHNRFIVSYPLIRRPDYRDSLLAHLGRRAEKGLLILDEAHVAAPAAASRYAVDSDTTRTIRDLAPKFDNRLFLSATPHNGHSNSFSALLEILDPARFTRGVPVSGAEALEPVMVRRLKRDLRKLGVGKFPERILTRIELRHGEGGWAAEEERYSAEEQRRESARSLASRLGGDDAELELTRLLERYTELCAPDRGRGRLVFINLQKRLLSSPEAFARTLEVHARAVERAGGVKVKAEHLQTALELDPEAYGDDDETLAAEEDAEVAAATRSLPDPTDEALGLLKKMRALAERARRTQDGKVRALIAWMRAHLCPAIGGVEGASKAWSDRRVILFTEYADTKRYVEELLIEALADTERGDERILSLQGGMGDDTRDQVQRAFNTPPDDHPVRILIATDSAREGVNLQAHCADLFHLDVPWNPSRMEQRNGRIDRTLQPESEVRCHYFVYAQRDQDRVLDTLVHKIQRVQRELGSVGAVLLDAIERTLEGGITAKAKERLERLDASAGSEVAERELEAQRKLGSLEADIHRAAQRLERSARALEVDAESLRGVVDIGLRMNGAQGLTKGEHLVSGRQTYVLPALDRSWEVTLDSLRPTRERDESWWEWRQKPPRPVTFEPLKALTSEAEQLHLAHPVVRRILDRFVAQGYGAHDLSRVCAVVLAGEHVSRVIAYARLTFFGHGAARLHDELISVVAPWTPGQAVTPYKDAVTAARTREQAERALATTRAVPGARVSAEVLGQASSIYATLWRHLEDEADSRAADVKAGLTRRARKESEELAALLTRQREAVGTARTELSQTKLFEVEDKEQRRQIELDLEHLARRAEQFGRELEEEPKKVEALYAVEMVRLSPVGLVVAWPEALT
jgi:superfamily II DNA or RNA helicase